MTSQPALDPSAFFFEGGPIGVLLVHGFTGAPTEMHLIGDYLNQRGLTTSAPLLPGHGTNLDDMNERRWPDWTSHIAREMTSLQSRCETVFICGLSLGSLIALYTVANIPDITGTVLYSPAIMVQDWRRRFLPIARYLVKAFPKPDDDFIDPEAASRLWEYDAYPVPAAHELMKFIKQVKGSLPDVSCPCLIIHSTGDESIHPESAQYVYDHISSADKELITLHHSGHVITLDSEWESVAEQTYQFITRLISTVEAED